MTSDTSIGLDDPRRQESGLDDEAENERRAREARKDGDAVADEAGSDPSDLTAEDIERGNDRNVSADDLGRSGTTNKLKDDGIDLGR